MDVLGQINAITDSITSGAHAPVILDEMRKLVKMALPAALVSRLFYIVFAKLEHIDDAVADWVALLGTLLRQAEPTGGAVAKKGHKRARIRNDEEFDAQEYAGLKTKALELFVSLLSRDLPPAHPLIAHIAATSVELMQSKSRDNKELLFQVYSLFILHHQHDAVPALEQNLKFFDFLAEPTADLVLHVAKDAGGRQFVSTLFSRLTQTDVSEAYARNVALFLKRITKTGIDKFVLSILVHVQSMIECPEHVVRSAVVGFLGRCLSIMLQTEDLGCQSLLALLIDRFRDTATYVRRKVIQVVSDALDCEHFYLSHSDAWLELHSFVANRLIDKNQPVRSAAIKTFCKFLLRHPFTLHGGSMDRAVIVELQQCVQVELDALTDDAVSEEIVLLAKKTRYFAHLLNFVDTVGAAVEHMGQLLSSKSKVEVLEAIQFFESAIHLGFPFSVAKMWYLIYNVRNADHAKDIQNMLVSTFQKIYLVGTTELIVKNLITLTYTMNLADKTCIEKILLLCFEQDWVSNQVVQYLWTLFSSVDDRFPIMQRRGAGLILSWINDDVNKVNTAVKVLSQCDDYLLLTYSCKIIKRLKHSRMMPSTPLFTSIHKHILGSGPDWFLFTQTAIQTVFSLCQMPICVLDNIIIDMAPEPQSLASDLERFCFILGQIAIQELVYLEDIEGAHKQRKKQSPTKNELEHVVGTAEDVFAETIMQVRQVELLSSHSLLGTYAPLIVHLVHTSSDSLKTFAATALTQLMCVSSSFCEKHLNVLNSVLKDAKDAEVTGNMMIALGDLLVCWSPIVSNSCKYLYACLARHVPISIKKNALMVLLHLILNGMVRVKGQLSHLALCLVDSDHRISGLTSLFFSELASKDHGLENNLSDVLSHLFCTDESEETIRIVLKKLFLFFEVAPLRERFLEGFVDKLGQRFRNMTNTVICRHLMYTATLIPMETNTEAKLRKFMDSYSLFEHALGDDLVSKYLAEFLTNAEKYCKSATEHLAKLKKK